MANIHTLHNNNTFPLPIITKKLTGTTSFVSNEMNEKKNASGFFYIISTADTPDSVYKIGKTTDCDPNKRLCKYPKFSLVKYTIAVENADLFEDIVMRKFKSAFKRRMELGLEYYEGDLTAMVCIVHQLWLNYGNIKIAKLIPIENIKPNGWQYYVNEWLSKHPFASDDEAYDGYVATITTDFGSREYAEKSFFVKYLNSTKL